MAGLLVFGTLLVQAALSEKVPHVIDWLIEQCG